MLSCIQDNTRLYACNATHCFPVVFYHDPVCRTNIREFERKVGNVHWSYKGNELSLPQRHRRQIVFVTLCLGGLAFCRTSSLLIRSLNHIIHHLLPQKYVSISSSRARQFAQLWLSGYSPYITSYPFDSSRSFILDACGCASLIVPVSM